MKNQKLNLILEKIEFHELLEQIKTKDEQQLRKASHMDLFSQDNTIINNQGGNDKVKGFRQQGEYGPKKFIKP